MSVGYEDRIPRRNAADDGRDGSCPCIRTAFAKQTLVARLQLLPRS